MQKADLKREKGELEQDAAAELDELTGIYEEQGIDPILARKVAIELTQRNALEAHAREELGINLMTKPKPLQAAIASAASFITGAFLPLLVALFAPMPTMVVFQYFFAILFLGLSGAISSHLGGTAKTKAVVRICFWGTIAMIITATVGYVFGTSNG